MYTQDSRTHNSSGSVGCIDIDIKTQASPNTHKEKKHSNTQEHINTNMHIAYVFWALPNVAKAGWKLASGCFPSRASYTNLMI